MKGNLAISLFGRFSLTYKGKRVTTVNSPRLQELLSYLLLNRQSVQSRQHLAFLLWPENSEKQAFSNLRQQLFHLRQALPDADLYLTVDSKSIQWNNKASFCLDISEFEQWLTEAKKAEKKGDNPLQEEALIQAEALYKGKLLISCYAEWITPERERLNQAYVKSLQTLIHLCSLNRNYSIAIRYAKKLLDNDQLRELTYREIMQLYALKGDKGKAIQYYRRCKEMLAKELGTSPSSATEDLYRRISDTIPVAEVPLPENKSSSSEENWPLVGHDEEWKTLVEAWLHTVNGKIQAVFIMGDPGIGKTRLARELYHFVRRQGYPAAYAKSYESAGTLSYGAVTGWLRQSFFFSQLEELETVWKQDLARLLPELLIGQKVLTPPGPIQEP